MNRKEIDERFEDLLAEEKSTFDLLKRLGADKSELKAFKKEIKFRLLYKHGLIFDLSPNQFAILMDVDRRTVQRHKKKWGFVNIINGKSGICRSNVHFFRSVMSGRSLRAEDARKENRGVLIS